jgi:hypothetical protein
LRAAWRLAFSASPRSVRPWLPPWRPSLLFIINLLSIARPLLLVLPTRHGGVAARTPMGLVIAAQGTLDDLAASPEFSLVFSKREVAFAALERIVRAAIGFAIDHG